MIDFTNIDAALADIKRQAAADVIAKDAADARIKELEKALEEATKPDPDPTPDPDPDPIPVKFESKPNGAKVTVSGMQATVQCPARLGAFQISSSEACFFNIKKGESWPTDGRGRSELAFPQLPIKRLRASWWMEMGYDSDDQYNIVGQIHSQSKTDNPPFSLNYDRGYLKCQTSQGTPQTIVTHDRVALVKNQPVFMECDITMGAKGAGMVAATVGGVRKVLLNDSDMPISRANDTAWYWKMGFYMQTGRRDFSAQYWQIKIW